MVVASVLPYIYIDHMLSKNIELKPSKEKVSILHLHVFDFIRENMSILRSRMKHTRKRLSYQPWFDDFLVKERTERSSLFPSSTSALLLQLNFNSCLSRDFLLSLYHSILWKRSEIVFDVSLFWPFI